MVFRITDKKRDKKVSINDMTSVMKRIKLKLDDT
jgi:Ca2+-binding EF-hand superfamily protein